MSLGYGLMGVTYQRPRKKKYDCTDSTRPRGTGHPASKLNNALVREIRASRETQQAIAKRLGVSQPTVQKIRARTIWTHVRDE